MRIKTLGSRALVINGQQVLLVKHTYQDGWYTIGGGIEPNESPITAIKRELLEEAGIIALSDPTLFSVYHNTFNGRDDYVVFYICNHFEMVPANSSEIAEINWFSFDNLPKDISPATKRRIEEYTGKKKITSSW